VVATADSAAPMGPARAVVVAAAEAVAVAIAAATEASR
jgi:hypothetical protein